MRSTVVVGGANPAKLLGKLLGLVDADETSVSAAQIAWVDITRHAEKLIRVLGPLLRIIGQRRLAHGEPPTAGNGGGTAGGDNRGGPKRSTLGTASGPVELSLGSDRGRGMMTLPWRWRSYFDGWVDQWVGLRRRHGLRPPIGRIGRSERWQGEIGARRMCPDGCCPDEADGCSNQKERPDWRSGSAFRRTGWLSVKPGPLPFRLWRDAPGPPPPAFVTATAQRPVAPGPAQSVDLSDARLQHSECGLTFHEAGGRHRSRNRLANDAPRQVPDDARPGQPASGRIMPGPASPTHTCGTDRDRRDRLQVQSRLQPA